MATSAWPVWCENFEHPHEPHPLESSCIYPHLTGPNGPPNPSVGHPLTPHD